MPSNTPMFSVLDYLPLFTDLSTDVTNPPVLLRVEQGQINWSDDYTYPGKKAALQSFVYRDLVPLQANLTRETLYEIALNSARKRADWSCLYDSEEHFRLQCIATTPLLKFRDDLVIEVRSDEKVRGAELHMRSRSRIGVTDLGTNAKRILTFFSEIESEIRKMNALKE